MTTKNKNIIDLGLRRPLIDYFTHNNQPITGGRGGEELRRGGATIGERVGARHSTDLGVDSDNEKKRKYNTPWPLTAAN